MYQQHYGFSALPFKLSPDVNFLYLSPTHAKAKAYMEYCLLASDGFVLITGEIGSGKTILVRKLLSEIDDVVLVAEIHQTQVDAVEFLRLLMAGLGYDAFKADKAEILNALNILAQNEYRAGRRIIVLIDEAQNLDDEVLEELRMVTEIEADGERLINAILLGQPELNDVINKRSMEQLAQRIRFRHHLEGLNFEETRHYIDHRLNVAGVETLQVFDADIFERIYEYTGGIPRLINVLCDCALINGFVEDAHRIGHAQLDAAIQELQWRPYSERHRLADGGDAEPEARAWG